MRRSHAALKGRFSTIARAAVFPSTVVGASCSRHDCSSEAPLAQFLQTKLAADSRGGCPYVSELVWAFHFVADTLGEFFDFIRFLDYFERENVLIGFVNVVF
jgi:hypothetical protein